MLKKLNTYAKKDFKKGNFIISENYMFTQIFLFGFHWST